MIIPKMQKIPKNATKEDRLKMFNDYKKSLVVLNQHHFDSGGNLKKWWEFWR